MKAGARKLSIGIGIATTAVVAGFLIIVLAKDKKFDNASAPTRDDPAVAVRTELPPPPADPQVALLGSASSISPEATELILVATVPGRTAQDGRAALGTDLRNPQTYAAGATLANGAVLEEIYADYVILSLNGKRSILGVSGITPHVREIHRELSTDAAAIRIGGEESVKKPLERVASSRIDLSDAIRAQPVFEHDAFAGLKILPGNDGGRLAALELQSGDIVRTIDGKRLKSPDEAWQALDDAISTSTPIVISVERDGALMSMSLDGSRLAVPELQVTSFETHPPSAGS